MATRKPYPQLPPVGPKADPLRHWLEWAARKLGLLPEALTATKEWNPGSVAHGSSASTTVEVIGARMGDPVSVGCTDQEPGVLFTGAVSDNDEVTVAMSNLAVAGGAFNMDAATLTVIVWRVI